MEDMDEKTVGSIFFANDEYVPRSRLSRAKRQLRVVTIFASACLLLLVFSLHGRQYVYHPNAFSAPAYYVQESLSNPFEQFQNCSITNFVSTYLPFLSTASPLHVSEFIQRRNNLAKALITDEIDAFIVEPGYTFQYYANISRKDWEVWEPEERPFLMIVQPVISEESRAAVKTRTVFLAPIFEVERVRLLGMPFEEELKIVPWEEHENPYVVLRKAWSGLNVNGGQKLDGRARKPKIMVDEEMRDFIQRGLGENGFKVVGLGGEVERVRQTKSEREIGILRAVNTGTVEAVRAMRECMQPGLTENEVMVVLDNTLRAGGLEPFFDIVLFDENASNPHGGTNGSKVLEAETFVLIDVGAHLYGYSSDICRTFFPPFFPKPSTPSAMSSPAHIQHKLNIWSLVLAAQNASLSHIVPNNTAASIDIAARNVITSAGYGPYFTHRVGHGIGIKAHESPYLNKGNTDVRLREGMVFTSEPGVYLVGEFGVRHEDVLLVRGEAEEPDVLSGRRAQGPWDP